MADNLNFAQFSLELHHLSNAMRLDHCAVRALNLFPKREVQVFSSPTLSHLPPARPTLSTGHFGPLQDFAREAHVETVDEATLGDEA